MSTPDCTTFSTLAIHAGFDPDPITGDVVPPIHVASTFVQDRPGELREGYEYGRYGYCHAPFRCTPFGLRNWALV